MAAALQGSYRSYQVYFNIIEARNIRAVEKDGKSDPFVTATCVINGKKVEVAKTHHITLTSHPQWWVDCYVDMEEPVSDVTFKMYDWNKILKSKKIGEAVLSYSAVTAEGSYHHLNLGKDNGTLLVFAKRFISDRSFSNFPTMGSCTRTLFDPVQRLNVRPGELMRVGHVVRVKKPIDLATVNFGLNQTYHGYKQHMSSVAQKEMEVRGWNNYVTAFQAAEWKSKVETGDSDAINSKHRPYGANLNVIPKTLCAGIHYFHLEFSYPSQDSCGRFIGGGTGEDIDTNLSIGVTPININDDTLGEMDTLRKASRTPISMKSDFYLHLKPTLPPMFIKHEVDEDTLFLEKVEISWAVPEQGRNRISPLPPHLYNPEVISEEDYKRWFISSDEDSKDAQGHERLYANLVWYRQEEREGVRHQSPHYLVLSEVTIDSTQAAEASSIVNKLNIEYSLRLVCDRFALSLGDPKASSRSQFIYKLTPTNNSVGRGKREYEVTSGEGPLHLIYTIPEEMCGHLQTSYVYVEVIATTPTDASKLWVLQRRPFFAEYSSKISAPPSSLQPLEPAAATGHFRASYTHYPFIDRAPEVVGDFGAPNPAVLVPTVLCA